MRRALVVAAIILVGNLVSNLASLNFSSNAEGGQTKQSQSAFVEVDRISKIIEIPPLSTYYFQIKNSTIHENILEQLPVLDALKRVPNWLRRDLEKNLLKMVDIKTDIGDNAAPALFDIDNDRDYDLVVGTREGNLLVYENRGSYWLKKDNLTDGNGNVIDVGSYAVSAFENLTGDSNLDLILGSYDGTLRVYENTTSGWEFKGYIRDVNNNIIDVGTHSAPAFGWVIYKTDGEHRADRRDLIIGCADGTIWCYESTVHLYENTMYNWKYRGKLAADGREIDVGNYSKPVLADLTGDTKNDLIVGAGDGSLHFYKCENTQNAEFYEDTTVYERVNDEYSDDYDYAAPTVADLDRNSLLPLDLLNDTIVGWGDGHIHIYKNVGTPSAPRWDVWPIAPTEIPTENYLRERNLSVLQKYLDLILDAENEYVDEIAFSIAHTSVDVLTNEDVYVEVFKKNAELIYEIDKYLQYADVVESGDYTVATPPANGYALLIGIEDYPETGNDLDYCLDDVYDMREALINFCNFSGSNIRILADTNANKSNIQNAINWLAANADSNDIVMFFYSGHGMSSGKLAQYDYSTQGGITSAELDSWLDNVTSTNIIIVLDCCFAGAFTSKNVKCIFENTKEWSNFFRGIAQEGRIICAACDENEYSWEFDELRNGAFSYYLTQALQSLKSDVNKNDWVSIEEAFNRAKPRVSNYVLTNTQERQIPQIYDGISGEVELVFFYPTGDYWTTIEYNISIGGVNETYELPRDIYYWYVVHPKITDEIPTFIDPDTEAPAKPPRGKFWREYLFFYADESYPPHPATDADGDGKPDFYYPKDAKPPLLKEKIANITILYDGVPYNAPSGYDDDGYLRDPDPNGNRRRSWKWSYEKNHAIEIVSNWVAKTLPLREQESNDDERPIQPVRIAHHHNGNCGELQDLTAAAARTCLIPASGICLIGEDHVWNEFYYDDAWHQWDNYWSDGGSVIDNFENYWVGWGRRGGSGIFRWNGDDSIEDVTSSYVPTAPYWTYTEAGSVYVPAAPLVKVVVNDSDGNPVDGALVVFSSYWLADHSIESIVGMSFGFVHYIPGAAIPSIWNFTDWNGIAEFRLVGDFSISVYSKLGSDTESSVTIKEVSDYETGNYTYEFKLQDTMPYPAYNKGSDKELMGDYYRADVSYSVLGEQYQKYTIRWPPTGPVYIGYYFEHFEKVDTSVDCFMTDQINARRYLQGLQFNYNRTWSTENVYGAEFSNVPLDDNNSILFSNIDSVETTKLVAVTIVLYRNQTPFELSLDIEKKPLELALSGKANYSFIKDVRVRLDYEDWLKANYYRPPDKNYWLWNYSLNLTQYYLGKHIISVKAITPADIHAFITTEIEFENKLPNVTIIAPKENEIVYNNVTAIVSVYDEDCVDGEVQKVWLGLNGIWELASKQDKNWTARLNTASLSDGTQKMYVKVFDGIVYYVKAIRIIIDNTKPNIVILKPSEYERVSGIIIIEGKALDANGVKNISLLLTHNDTKEAFPITDKVVPDVLGTWSYELNTTNYYEGSYNLTATAFDGRYINTTSIIIVIDNNKPPEILYSPMNATITIEENSTQEFRVVDAKDPEGRILTKYWYLRKELITGEFSEWQNITDQALSDNGTYLFKADYTSSGMYQIKVVVWDVYYYGTNVGSENVTQIWSLTVKNVNRMPQILVYTNSIDPLARELIINELDSIEFAVDCIDSDNDTLFINWSVNNVLKYSGRTTPSAYTFNTDYKSSGDYIVEVNISDSCDSISLKWLVRVKNVNRAPTAAFSPLLPVGEYRNITAYTYEIFSIESVSDEDEDNLTITWRVNGKVMKVTVIREVPGSDKYTHEFREGGLWNVSVEIFDGKTRILNYWLVNVYVEPKVEPPTFELGIAVCAILAAALIALSIKILRKK